MVNAPKLIAQICANRTLNYDEKGMLICLIVSPHCRWRQNEYDSEDNFMKHVEFKYLAHANEPSMKKVLISLSKKGIINNVLGIHSVSIGTLHLNKFLNEGATNKS